MGSQGKHEYRVGGENLKRKLIDHPKKRDLGRKKGREAARKTMPTSPKENPSKQDRGPLCRQGRVKSRSKPKKRPCMKRPRPGGNYRNANRAYGGKKGRVSGKKKRSPTYTGARKAGAEEQGAGGAGEAPIPGKGGRKTARRLGEVAPQKGPSWRRGAK